MYVYAYIYICIHICIYIYIYQKYHHHQHYYYYHHNRHIMSHTTKNPKAIKKIQLSQPANWPPQPTQPSAARLHGCREPRSHRWRDGRPSFAMDMPGRTDINGHQTCTWIRYDQIHITLFPVTLGSLCLSHLRKD